MQFSQALPLLALTCLLTALSAASAQVIIDMPAPPPEEEPATVGQSPGQAAAEQVDVGEVALVRYSYYRSGARNTYWSDRCWRHRRHRWMPYSCWTMYSGWPYNYWHGWGWPWVIVNCDGDNNDGDSSDSGG